MSATRSGTRRTATAGFSIVELVISICVMLILTALAVPSLLHSLRAYQLAACWGPGSRAKRHYDRPGCRRAHAFVGR